MAPTVNKDYTEIAAHGNNYLAWAMDIKIMPLAHVSDTTSHFLRHHLHLDLKILENDPANFGLHSKDTMINKGNNLPEAQQTSNLSQNTILQCPRFVASFCFDQTLDDEKKGALSSFSLSNRLLQQQYRWHNNAKYSNFIHQLRPAGPNTTTGKSPE